MLVFEDIHVYYGHVHALKGMSFEIKEGELVTMLGANGAGKSTTLLTISGIIKPTHGRILFEGHNISGLPPNTIVHSGIIHCPEGRHIFGNLSVRENLMMGAIQRHDHAQVKQDFEWIYSLFPILKERIGQNGSTLSGGEQQMLAIGRALMARPRLLLLDEPSLGLAPVVVQIIFDVIQQLRHKGVTILLVEQNARKALQIADRGYLLETGQVVLSGSVQDLHANPAIERHYLGG